MKSRSRKYELFDIYMRPYLAQARTEDGYKLSGLIPILEMKEEEQQAIRTGKPVNFLFSPNRSLSKLDGMKDRDKASKNVKFSDWFQHYLLATSYAYSEVTNILNRMSYVGPLRRRSQRYYRVAAAALSTVGVQGENAPHLFRSASSQLKKEINTWIRRFDLGKSLTCRNICEDLFELCFENDSDCTNVADAGFGASQVLPLILQALAAPRDSLTLAEQPEIHLNPRLQSVLADLFVHMANAAHRVIVETHSEHLLLRLRTLIAQGVISTENVAVYFVEKQASSSTIRRVPIGANGNIEKSSWPTGFFDDALREALTLATAQSKLPNKTKRG